ncbi:MAG: hydrogenase maturation protease [Spirochaetales bacterium]|nr:hydrogenase maturation protease [Spirochaetales bacterium]
MKRKPIAVIGLGNILVQDDSAGIQVVLLLEKLHPDLPVDFIHAGTPGFHLVHQCEERKKIIFIDAGYCEAPPGEFRRFTRDQVKSVKHSSGYSLHEFDLITFLDMTDKMGFLEDVEVVIYCIQTGESGYHSEEAVKGFPALISAVYEELLETAGELAKKV